MVERLEAAAETGAEYYMVTVSESVTFSYPALATDAEAAREKVAALIEAGRIDTTPLITHRFPLDRAMEAYRTFEAHEDGCMKVVLTPIGE